MLLTKARRSESLVDKKVSKARSEESEEKLLKDDDFTQEMFPPDNCKTPLGPISLIQILVAILIECLFRVCFSCLRLEDGSRSCIGELKR
jgi:hypothetical protein